MNDIIKDLNDRIQGLQVEQSKLKRPCPNTGRAAYEARELRLKEIEEEIADLQNQLAEAQARAVAGAIGKGA